VSGGKDSHVLFELAYAEATKRRRRLGVFFIDQEAEYQATIDVIRGIMSRPIVDAYWYQVPLYMTSAVSYEQEFLHAWGPGEKWMREKDDLAIHAINALYPQRFYPFIDWFEAQWPAGTAFLVGLRAEESLNRHRAMTKNPGVADILWSTKGRGNVIKFYPIYDWAFDDVFYHFYLNNVRYNRIYDFMHSQNDKEHIANFRVSNLIHEKAYKSLTALQAFEPETYARLIERLNGTRTAALYAKESFIYSNGRLPKRFATWREYRDYLLTTLPTDRAEAFGKRFGLQADDERTCKHQAKQLLINDWENNVPVASRTAAKGDADWRAKWKEIL